MAKKSGQMAKSENKSGQKKMRKNRQNRLKMAKKGLFWGVFGQILRKKCVRGQKPTFSPLFD